MVNIKEGMTLGAVAGGVKSSLENNTNLALSI